jgi:signal transduction histidine kinase
MRGGAALFGVRIVIAGVRRARPRVTAEAAAGVHRHGGWSLRLHLLGLIALFLAAMIGGAVYVHMESSATARQSSEASATFAARAAAAQISADLDQLRTSVDGLAATPGLAKLFAAVDPACSLSFGGSGAFSTGHIDILDSNGSVACSSTPGAHTTSYAAAPWLAGALQAKTLVAPYRDPATGGQVVLSAAPVAGGRGMVVGFLDLQPVAPLLTKTYGGAGHLEFLVTDAAGSVALARSVDPAKWTARPLSGTPFAAPRASSSDGKDVDGTPRVYATATAATAGWHVYAGETTAAALAAAHSLALHDWGILGGAALIVTVGALLLHRRIARPITRLETRIATAHDGDSFQPIQVEGPAEIAGLAVSFNHMMASVDGELARRRETEERLNESLERLESVDGQRRRLLDKIVTAQEEERRRIASDVHDDSVQVMAAALMRISLIRQQPLDPTVDRQLAKLQETTEKAIERLRHLLFQLCPPSLDREGLVAALNEYLEQWTEEANLTYAVVNGLTFEPPLHIRAKLFRIAQEALTNVRKHAHANQVTVTLGHRSGGVTLRIEDDGVGMGGAELGPAPIGHLGLATMRERADLAGGWCTVETGAAGGTVVSVFVPVSSSVAAVA